MYGISITRSLLACACVVAALAGCKKAESPPTPAMDSSNPASSSVAAPSEAMPPSDATMPTAPPSSSSSSGDATGGPPQSSPSELNKGQESSAMPLPGQTNNHSTVTPEKEK